MRTTIGGRTFDFDREVAVMAIVNRTPDSFYDRGATYALDAAVTHALGEVADGADILDVGGVKAGPGAHVGVAEELERVMPFIAAFRAQCDIPLSIDTFRPEVAAAALDAGADMVNDTSGLADPRLADVVAQRGAALVVMHAGGEPRTRPLRNHYHPDVVTVVRDELQRLARRAEAAGVTRTRIVVDPGHDFRKNTLHSLALTRELPQLCQLGYPVLVALSNKDFIGEALGLPEPAQRVHGSVGAAVTSVLLGARLVRVHNTLQTVHAVRMAEVILGWREPRQTLRGLE